MDELLKSVTPKDMEQIKTELGKSDPSKGDSGEQPKASSLEAKEVTEKASKEVPDEATTVKSESTTKETSTTSEGDKTHSEKTFEPSIRRSKSVPYDRFRKVIQERNDLQAQLDSNKPNTAPSSSTGVSEAGQPVIDDYSRDILTMTSKLIDQKLAPYSGLTKDLIKDRMASMDDEDLAKALSSTPEAAPYVNEIKAYAANTPLSFDDLITLVMAKHQKEAQIKEKKQVDAESKEADLGGPSNSAARRRISTPHQLSDAELDKQVKEMENKGSFSL